MFLLGLVVLSCVLACMHSRACRTRGRGATCPPLIGRLARASPEGPGKSPGTRPRYGTASPPTPYISNIQKTRLCMSVNVESLLIGVLRSLDPAGRPGGRHRAWLGSPGTGPVRPCITDAFSDACAAGVKSSTQSSQCGTSLAAQEKGRAYLIVSSIGQRMVTWKATIRDTARTFYRWHKE